MRLRAFLYRVRACALSCNVRACALFFAECAPACFSLPCAHPRALPAPCTSQQARSTLGLLLACARPPLERRAHRLKNDATLTNKALSALPCKRRVLLSGTPMQNHLDEFFSMADFCNPVRACARQTGAPAPLVPHS